MTPKEILQEWIDCFIPGTGQTPQAAGTLRTYRHPLFRRHLRAVPSPALRPCHRRILGTAYEPRRQSDRQGTHQPRRHRPDHRRRAQHPARSPAATRHTDSPYPQPSLRQPAPQQRRPAADGTREESRPNHEHTPDRPRHRHGRKPLQLQRRRIAINNPSYGHTIRKTKAVITLTISTLYLPAIYQPM